MSVISICNWNLNLKRQLWAVQMYHIMHSNKSWRLTKIFADNFFFNENITTYLTLKYLTKCPKTSASTYNHDVIYRTRGKVPFDHCSWVGCPIKYMYIISGIYKQQILYPEEQNNWNRIVKLTHKEVQFDFSITILSFITNRWQTSFLSYRKSWFGCGLFSKHTPPPLALW